MRHNRHVFHVVRLFLDLFTQTGGWLLQSILCALLLAPLGLAQSEPGPALGDCNAPLPDPIAYVNLPTQPLGTAATKDGCWVFVALGAANRNSRGGVALLRQLGGKVEIAKIFPIEGNICNILLTHDQQLLIVAVHPQGPPLGFVNLLFMSVERMLSRKDDAVLGYLMDPISINTLDLKLTTDDRFLFVADHVAGQIRVIDFEKARIKKFSSSTVIGRIPAGHPTALMLSPDEKLLYATIEGRSAYEMLNHGGAFVATPDFERNRECPGLAPGSPPELRGAVIVIDVEKAKTDPGSSVVKRVAAGCRLHDLALSADGKVLYAVSTTTNSIIVFDTQKMLSDPVHAVIRTVPVGKLPIGVTWVEGGSKLMVANSNCRFLGCPARQPRKPVPQEIITVIDATKISNDQEAVVAGTVTGEEFPSRVGSSSDGRTLFLSSYGSNFLEVIDWARAVRHH